MILIKSVMYIVLSCKLPFCDAKTSFSSPSNIPPIAYIKQYILHIIDHVSRSQSFEQYTNRLFMHLKIS